VVKTVKCHNRGCFGFDEKRDQASHIDVTRIADQQRKVAKQSMMQENHGVHLAKMEDHVCDRRQCLVVT